jgi:hypothetical protein
MTGGWDSSQDRKGLSPMEIVAVLTKVIQNQQDTRSKLQERMSELGEKKSQKNELLYAMIIES